MEQPLPEDNNDIIVDDSISVKASLNASLDQYLKAQQWKYEKEDRGDYQRYTLGFNLKNASFRTYFELFPERYLFYVKVYFTQFVPLNSRLKIAELIIRINYRLALAQFDMDMDDGELRVIECICIEGSQLSQEMIGHMENTALFAMDDYFPAFMAVIHGGKSPKEALDEFDACNTEAEKTADESSNQETPLH